MKKETKVVLFLPIFICYAIMWVPIVATFNLGMSFVVCWFIPGALFVFYGFLDMERDFKKAKKKKILEYKNSKFLLPNYNSSNTKKSFRCKIGFHNMDYEKNYRYCVLCGNVFVRVSIGGISQFFNLTKGLKDLIKKPW